MPVPFTPKVWENYPSTATPINAAALIDGETRLAAHADARVKIVGEVLPGLDLTGTTDNASTIQTAINNLDSQGGGRLLLPGTNPSLSGRVRIGSLISVPQYVSVEGQGMWETELRCSAAAAGFIFRGVGDTPSGSRGGMSGRFRINGNQVANTCMEVHAVNRNFEDMRCDNPKAAGGKGLYLYGCQNCYFYGFDGEDQYHTSASRTQGVVLDGTASGNNFEGLRLNEWTDGHIVVTQTSTPSGFSVNVPPMHNGFHDLMIERSDSGLPIIQIKAGSVLSFSGGNIAMGEDFEPTGDCAVVKISNDAPYSYNGALGVANGGSGQASTRAIDFRGINFTGALGAGGVKWANAFHCTTGLNNWYDTLFVDPTCKYSNCKYLARIDEGTTVVNARFAADTSGGGLAGGWSNPLGAGKINTIVRSSASAFPVRSTCDYYEVSGNTNINSLNATYAGQRIVMKFSGTPTISSSAGNIKLSGLVDMAVTADDLLCLICDGTNWHETSRVVK